MVKYEIASNKEVSSFEVTSRSEFANSPLSSSFESVALPITCHKLNCQNYLQCA